MAVEGDGVRFSWVHIHDDSISYAHMSMIEEFTTPWGETLMAAAFQASGAGCEGNDTQHLRFTVSRDGGESWGPSCCVMWGLQALWSPVLHYHAKANKLYLFYSESRKAHTPGGDVKYILSTDCGASWGCPVTILTHEADGEVPKVLANKLLVLDSEAALGAGVRWILPFWREPFNSFLEYPAYHPLKDSPPALDKQPPPGALVPQSKRNSAGVLILDSPDTTGPHEWRVAGDIHDPDTWLIENTLEVLSDGRLLMLFRSGTGYMWQSISADRGDTWAPATEISLPNPNSKFSMCRLDTTLVVCYNHSSTQRAPLDIATSTDDGATWKHMLCLESDLNGHFAYPTVAPCTGGGAQLAASYSFWAKGIRLARFSLPLEGQAGTKE
eukprot:CAMPEP_0117668668 /NCGR_PEP_ID=MMETSP0804-20121206/11683_1 /TAXON_ID=1074897 /ORGANISM="Tetraselmis astigmatica, Strain CCMP880" /LENGTH=383 /DNA_ID=CAMNT_0005476597 /DNA_START=81 /DNA_END=1232 /DNA_ORIENTATION=-